MYYIDEERKLKFVFRCIKFLKARLIEVKNTSISIEYYNASTDDSKPIDHINIDNYPPYYKITYLFPKMYVTTGGPEISEDVSYSFWLSSTDILKFYKNRNPSLHDICEILKIDKDGFDEDVIPFNSSISKSWIFPQNKLLLENIRKYGIIYLIVAWGALLNQEDLVMDNDDVIHLNPTAYKFWVEALKKKPLNSINWPFSLSNPEADRYNYELVFNGTFIDNWPCKPEPQIKTPKFTIGTIKRK